MEIDHRFGHRLYTFFSQSDVFKAQSLYVLDHFTKSLEEFETLMEAHNIDFIYSITEAE